MNVPTQWGSGGSPSAILGWVAEHLPRGRILNLGAGPRAPIGDGQVYVGVDLVATASAGLFSVADALHLPFASGSFDGALCKDIIEHTLDPIGVLREVSRVCNPRATLVVTVPRALPRAVWADPTHIRGFTAGALLQALDAGGWDAAGAPRRVGGFPGAGRLGLDRHLLRIMQMPGFGHWYGTNWFVTATRRP